MYSLRREMYSQEQNFCLCANYLSSKRKSHHTYVAKFLYNSNAASIAIKCWESFDPEIKVSFKNVANLQSSCRECLEKQLRNYKDTDKVLILMITLDDMKNTTKAYCKEFKFTSNSTINKLSILCNELRRQHDLEILYTSERNKEMPTQDEIPQVDVVRSKRHVHFDRQQWSTAVAKFCNDDQTILTEIFKRQ
jgi:hypothetical protein